MNDALFGLAYGATGTVAISDDLSASAQDPRVQVTVDGASTSLDMAQLWRLIATLRTAQELLTARREQALCDKTLPLF